MSNGQIEKKFDVREIREMVKDLMLPNPFLYWADFLFHVTLGWVSFYLCFKSDLFSIAQNLFFFVSTFALFRAAVFTHELAHLRKGTFSLFRAIWNLLCGFPLMIPSFLYQGVHNDHHNINLYGTKSDGEYFPFVHEGRRRIILFLLASLFFPVLFLVRFVFLAPISCCHRGLRSLVLEKISSLSIDLSYSRTLSSLNSVPSWRAQEAITCLYGWVFLLLLVVQIIPFMIFSLWLSILGAIFFINSLRTLAAHCYRYSGNKILNISEQILDSVNTPESLFGILWAPVGLRFHAAHHLIPEMPYHSLGKMHDRLMEKFSGKNIYAQTTSRSLILTLKRLWGEAKN